MSPLDASLYLCSLAATALVGRVVLAWLPPGLPGRHRLRDLPLTWATSHLSGLFVLTLEMRCVRGLGNEPHVATFFLPWLALALVRVATLPGAMVARHEPRAPHVTPLVHALRLALLIPIVGAFVAAPASFHGEPLGDGFLRNAFWVLVQGLEAGDGVATTIGSGFVHAASFGALLVFVLHGLRVTRRAPLPSTAATLALAWLFGTRTDAISAMYFTAGATFALPWLRRVDPRARALSVLAFLALVVFDCDLWGLSLIGIATLFGVSRVPVPKEVTPAPIDPPRREVLFLMALLAITAIVGWAGPDGWLAVRDYWPATALLLCVSFFPVELARETS